MGFPVATKFVLGNLYYLRRRQGGYVFGSVCLSVCLSVRLITEKVVNGFLRNFLEG